jgi:hypothetical protein
MARNSLSSLQRERRHTELSWATLSFLISGSPRVVAVAISIDFQAKLHALRNSQYCVPSEHQNRAFGSSPGKRSDPCNVNVSVCSDFSVLECEQRVIIEFLLREKVNVNDMHRRVQAQGPDGTYSIRSVRR